MPTDEAKAPAALEEIKADELVRLARIEGKLGLPHGYYQSLKDQGTDWEFSIKLVVLLEAALGSVIAANLQSAAVQEHCERLNLNGRAGKLSSPFQKFAHVFFRPPA